MTTANDETRFERIDKNIVWYSRKSGQCQALYKCLKLGQILLAASIPAISALSIGGSLPEGPVATGILGMLIVTIEGVQSTFQPLEKWMLYRSAAEGLKREKALYVERAGPYDGPSEDGARKLFVARTEELMGAEHAGWREANRPRAATTGGGDRGDRS